MNNIESSKILFTKAQELIPGGVNSPVRAFKAVGGKPIFMASAKGAYMTDVDGNKYLDLINSWGPMILGHGNEGIESAVAEAIKDSLSFGAPSSKEVDIAELIVSMVPGIDKVRMVNSGTEATMSAIRLARGFTERDKIIKFEGCYHGHGDSFLIAAGSGATTLGVPNSPGVTEGVAKDTLTAKYNNIDEVKALFTEYKGEIAALIVEPVAGNMGCVLPDTDFLQQLRIVCNENGTLLIFDEVMTGFRLAKGGAQEVYGVNADLVTFGKIIGGGMPVGAYAGSAEIMDYVAPSGPVYQAGTLSGNPIAMSAGLSILSTLNGSPEIYTALEKRTEQIENGIHGIFEKLNLPFTTNRVGSMMNIFFTDKKVTDFDDAKTTDTELFGRFFQGMLDEGIYLPPSQYETWFISTKIGDKEQEMILSAIEKVLTQIIK